MDVLGYIGHLLQTRGPQDMWVRQVMEADIAAQLSRLDPSRCDAIEVSGDQRSELGWRSYRNVQYPEVDLTVPFDLGELYDVVWAEQVLEHVEEPTVAIENLFRLTRPGGTLIVSTPFLVRLHEMPRDFYRYTPPMMERLLRAAGFDVAEVKHWGNRAAVVANLLHGDYWMGYRRWMPLKNDPDFPVMVWTYARKPGPLILDGR